jgi:hypothetical protein
MNNKESMRERFDKEFVKDNGDDVEPSFNDPSGDVESVRLFIEKELSLALKSQREEIEVLTKIIDKYEKLVTLQEKDMKMSNGLLKEALDSYKELLKNLKQD